MGETKTGPALWQEAMLPATHPILIQGGPMSSVGFRSVTCPCGCVGGFSVSGLGGRDWGVKACVVRTHNLGCV